MAFSVWSIALLTSKLFVYAGIAAAVSGPYIQWISGSSSLYDSGLNRYRLLLLVPALIAGILSFFIQVGALSDTGFGGLWDPLMRDLLWQTPAATSLIFSVAGFVTAIVLIIGFPRHFQIPRFNVISVVYFVLYFGSVLSLAASLSVIGHTAEMAIAFKLVIGLHVVAMAWWIGSLWPLRLVCYQCSEQAIFSLMHRFGRHAVYIVSALLLSGGVLVWQLLDSWNDLFYSNYGRILLIKLVLVSLILLLAAWHKVYLVPKLIMQKKASTKLSRSIGFEISIAISLLLVTATFTTLVGPDH